MSQRQARVYIGTSGFQYRHWRGRFYPSALPAAEMLAYYAERFSCLEINSTYYGIPAPRVLARLAAATPPTFLFAVKAYQGLTHAPGVDENLCYRMAEAVAPLRQTGQLALLLFQFPRSFRPTQDNLDKLQRLREEFVAYRLAVEFRHRQWLQRPFLELATRLDLAWCCVDEPALPGLLPPLAVATNSDGYVRFHGRNTEQWYSGNRDQRYNYLYRERELLAWQGGLRQLVAKTDRLFIFMNNCHLGHAAKNAAMLQAQLTSVCEPIID